MRTEFHGQLMRLHDQLILMGDLCEEAIGCVLQALTENRPEPAKQVSAVDAQIDQLERDIENLCLKLLLKQQPVAGDLRQISAALKMITDMERIGDQAQDIAEIIPFLSGSRQNCESVARMGRAASSMVGDSVDAYVQGDLDLARRVIAADDTVDDYFTKIKTELIAQIAAHPQEGEADLDLLMIAKYFERIADHATNIAEWVEYSVTGVHRSDEMGCQVDHK